MVEDGKLNANAIGLKPNDVTKIGITNNNTKKTDEIQNYITTDNTDTILIKCENIVPSKNIVINNVDNLSAMLFKKLEQNRITNTNTNSDIQKNTRNMNSD